MLAQALSALVALTAGFAAHRASYGEAVVADLVDELVLTADHRSSPERARSLVEELYSRFFSSEKKDRREIAAGIGSFLQSCELGAEADPAFGPRREVACEAANALSLMGQEGVAVLLASIGERRDGDLAVERCMVLALGRTRSADALPRLLALLHHPEAVVQGAAAEALGEFGKLEGERRKDVFYALLQTLQDAWDKLERDPFDVGVRQRYDVIVAPITTSLQRLSGHDERDPSLWQRFWNKHKRDDWDEDPRP
jgi:HEAT repeat protein